MALVCTLIIKQSPLEHASVLNCPLSLAASGINHYVSCLCEATMLK